MASTFLPSNPPFLLMSSTIIRMVSLSVVSLIAIVPDNECKTPILIVPWACAGAVIGIHAMTAAAASAYQVLFTTLKPPLLCLGAAQWPVRGGQQDRGQAQA